MPTPTFPAPARNGAAEIAAPPPLASTLAAIRGGDLDVAQISRLSDLGRDDARLLTRAWETLDEEVRAAIVRRMDELSEERIELIFGRALRVALADESAVVRQLAVAGLWEDQGEDLIGRFLDLLGADPSQDVRAEAARGLERFAERAVAGDLDHAIEHRLRVTLTDAVADERVPDGVRRRALEAVGAFAREGEVRGLILSSYEGEDEGLRASALYAMGRSLDPRWLETVLAELASDESELRYEAVRASGALGDERAVPELRQIVLDEDVEVRHAAIAALGQIGGRSSLQILRAMAAEPEEADVEAIDAALEEAAAVEPSRAEP